MAIVVITGCGSGLGKAAARGFAEHGYTVYASSRAAPRSGPSAPERLPGGGEIHALYLDVTDSDSRRTGIAHVLAEQGAIDVLVNNAGILDVGAFEDTSEERMRRVFETNYFGPVALSTAVLPSMRSKGSGRIINVTAMGALYCTPCVGTYCAAKHALDGASAAMDLEVSGFGIRVISVLPGLFNTQIATKAWRGIESSVYSTSTVRMREGLASRVASASQDYAPFVNAVIEAATAHDPRPRYVIGDSQLVTRLRPLVDDLERLHREELIRQNAPGCGFAEVSGDVR